LLRLAPFQSRRTGNARRSNPKAEASMSAVEEKTAQTMEIAELETQRLPLSDVSPHPQNPRIHNDRQIEELQASLREHGYGADKAKVI